MSEDTAPAAAAADRPDAEPTDRESPSEQTADEKLVPVSEAIRYRRGLSRPSSSSNRSRSASPAWSAS